MPDSESANVCGGTFEGAPLDGHDVLVMIWAWYAHMRAYVDRRKWGVLLRAVIWTAMISRGGLEAMDLAAPQCFAWGQANKQPNAQQRRLFKSKQRSCTLASIGWHLATIIPSALATDTARLFHTPFMLECRQYCAVGIRRCQLKVQPGQRGGAHSFSTRMKEVWAKHSLLFNSFKKRLGAIL
jgi:hypothetical protein